MNSFQNTEQNEQWISSGSEWIHFDTAWKHIDSHIGILLLFQIIHLWWQSCIFMIKEVAAQDPAVWVWQPHDSSWWLPPVSYWSVWRSFKLQLETGRQHQWSDVLKQSFQPQLQCVHPQGKRVLQYRLVTWHILPGRGCKIQNIQNTKWVFIFNFKLVIDNM